MARVLTTQPMADHAGLSSRPPSSEGSDDFDAIYRRYRSGLVRYAKQRGAEDAEGVANLALLDLARAYDRLRSTEAPVLRAYLYKAARSYLARERSGPSPVSLDEGHFADSDETGLETFEDAIARNLDLDELLTQLSVPQEQALRLRFYRQMTSAEAATVMDIDASTVRTHQRRGLTRLRQLVLAGLAILIIVGLAAVLSGSNPDLILNSPVSPVETSVTTTPPRPTVPLPAGQAQERSALAPPLEERLEDSSAAIGPTVPSPASTAAEVSAPPPADPAPPAAPSAPTPTVPEPATSITAEAPVLTQPAPTTSTTVAVATLPLILEPTTTTTSPGQFDPLSVFDSSIFWLSSFVAGNDCLAQQESNLAFVAESCRDGVHPRWRTMRPNGGDNYQIMDTTLTSCWTVEISSNVGVAPCTGAANQLWSIVHVGGYRVTSVLDGRCLGIEGGASGSNIAVADCVAQNHQTWGVYWQAL